jgi:hypothetical protein
MEVRGEFSERLRGRPVASDGPEQHLRVEPTGFGPFLPFFPTPNHTTPVHFASNPAPLQSI